MSVFCCHKMILTIDIDYIMTSNYINHSSLDDISEEEKLILNISHCDWCVHSRWFKIFSLSDETLKL